MPTFQYTARDQAGQIQNGVLEAATDSAAAADLREQGLWPTSIRATRRGPGESPAAMPAPPTIVGAPGGRMAMPGIRPSRRRSTFAETFIYPVWTGVTTKDLALMYRQFATMIGAGIPMYKTLVNLQQQTQNKRLRGALEQITQRVLEGGKLSEGMAEFPFFFNRMQLRLIQAAEQGGLLHAILTRLADYLDREYALILKIRQKMMYPFLLLLAFIFIPPIPVLVLAGVKPYLMVILLKYGPGVLTMGLIAFAWRFLRRIEVLADVVDQAKLALPIVGKFVKRLAVARFARSLGALYHAGVGVWMGMQAAGEACGNRTLERKIKLAAPSVERGASLTAALQFTQFFEPMFLGMVATGHETGDLDRMLDKAADYYESEAEHAINQQVVILGVLLLLTMAVVIGSQVIAAYAGHYQGYGTPE